MMYPARHGPDAVLFRPAADSLKNISESICHEENARYPDDPGARLLILRSRPECSCPAGRSGGDHGSGPCRQTRPKAAPQKMEAGYRGNPESKIYHNSSCRYYKGKSVSKTFASPADAKAAGYRPCKVCKG